MQFWFPLIVFLLATPLIPAADLQPQRLKTFGYRDYAGADCGAQINEAYAALPSEGGIIEVGAGCTFSTPIVFGTSNKAVQLRGNGNATRMIYSGTGTAITFNNGNNFDWGSALEGIALRGPGNATATTGLLIGGTNGAIGFNARHFLVETFGTNLTFGNNTWTTSFRDGMFRDATTNVLWPAGLSQAGENILFDHVTFADAPQPHTDNVWLKGSNADITFASCSFDQAQLTIGDATTGPQVIINGTHFEDPNYVIGGVPYVFIKQNAFAANYTRLTDSYFFHGDTAAGPTAFVTVAGGKFVASGTGMYTARAITNFITLSGAANADLLNFNDLSGAITGPPIGGTTTGCVGFFTTPNSGLASMPNQGSICGTTSFGAVWDIEGNVRAKNGQLVSTIATGTAPLVVNSTTPVNNLFGNVRLYDATGTQITNSTHGVYGRVQLSGGLATVTLAGAAVFTDNSSYRCIGTSETGTNAVRISLTSGTQFSVAGTNTDWVAYQCFGY